MSKQIFVVWGSSDVGGHAPIGDALPLAHGDDVFLFKDGIFTQNPDEPVFHDPAGPHAGTGSTPLRYFADELAGLSGDEVAFMRGFTPAANNWHVGVERLTTAVVNETLAMLQPALDAGWHLGGVILGIGPGDADTWREVQTYEHRWLKAVARVRAAFGEDTPVFNMQTELCKGNTLDADYKHRVAALRKEMIDVTHHTHDAVGVRSNIHWNALPGHSEAFHLDVPGQVLFGHAIADAVFDFWS